MERYLKDFFTKKDGKFIVQRMKRMSKIKDANISISDVKEGITNEEVKQLIKDCWKQDPIQRMKIEEIVVGLDSCYSKSLL